LIIHSKSMATHFPKLSEEEVDVFSSKNKHKNIKATNESNDKTIIELGYRKISYLWVSRYQLFASAADGIGK